MSKDDDKRFGLKTKASGGIAAMLAILAPFTMHHEGVRLKAYADTGGIQTICYGETEGVHRGDVATLPQCTNMLYIKLGFFGSLVNNYVGRDDLPNEVWAASTDLAYNIGWGAWKKSTQAKMLKAGQYDAACNQFIRFKYVAGADCRLKSSNCPGIITRRVDETNLCYSGLHTVDDTTLEMKP